MTPKGTRPDDKPARASTKAADDDHDEAPSRVGASSRYTPPVPTAVKESPPWVPILMLGLLVVGGIIIMLRYIVFTDSNWVVFLGLVFVLGGLYTATKWR